MKLAVSGLTALAPGSTVKQFAVVECLGIDVHTGLYRAESTDTEHPVLLMEYLPAGLIERHSGQVVAVPGEAGRFQRATTAYSIRLREAALVGHPAIPVLDDCWQENDALYGIGPWQAGSSLPTYLSRFQAPPTAELLRQWARTICDALASLHEHDLLHGNLAFHMFRVRKTGELVLPLVAGELFGNEMPPCIAPEQHPLNSHPGPIGPWSDVYQLSAVMHQLISGVAPPTVLQRWEGAPLESLEDELQREITGLIRATRKGLAMHHDARPQSIAAWLEVAGLPDRRSHSRHLPEVNDPVLAAPSVALPRRRAVSSNTLALPLVSLYGTSSSRFRASGWSNDDSARDGLDHLDDPDGVVIPTEETPVWVWLCLGVAVAAFLSILLRTI